jgi:hypothetical protein
MPHGKDLMFGLGVDLAAFGKELGQAARMAENLKTSPVELAAAATGPAAGTGGLADKTAEAGAGAAESMQPLIAIAYRLERAFDRVGGTVVTLARRIDDAIKAPKYDAVMKRLEEAMPNAFLRGTVKSVKILGGFQSFLTNFGDVSRKNLSQVFRGFSAPIPKIAQTAGAITGVNSVVKATTFSVGALARQMALAFGLFSVGFKIVEFFKTGILGAMTLGETVSKTKVIFGEAAGEVNAFADQMAGDFGLVKNEILDAGAKFGAIGKGADMANGKAAKFAKTMTLLSADLMSQDNIDFSTATERLRSVLGGETQVVRAHGALMNEAAVKAKGLAMGLADVETAAKGSAGELTDAAKVVARAALVSDQLSRVNGDLVNTAGSAANQLRKASGSTENLAVSIGQTLLPAVESAVLGFNEFTQVASVAFDGNRLGIEAYVSKITAFVDIVRIGIRSLDLILEAAGLAIKQIAMNAGAAFVALAANVIQYGEFVGTNWRSMFADMASAASTGFTNILDNATRFGSALTDAIQGKGFNFQFKPLLDGFKATTAKLPEMIKPAWVSFEDQIAGKFVSAFMRESDRAKAIANAAPMMGGAAKTTSVAAAAAAADKPEHKLAAAVAIDSKDAYQAIARNNNRSPNPVTKIITQQLQVQRDQLAELKKNNAKAGPVAIVKGF